MFLKSVNYSYGGKIMCENYKKYIRNKIDELRRKRDISEYQLSLELGHSQGYIQSITSGRVLPSMTSFLEICAYFEIKPADFFDTTTPAPIVLNQLIEDMKLLPEDELLLLSTITKKFLKNHSF
ncbi:MAG: helix-turn-helix transcriptional regulator [Bacilli bacterium]|nr:helix-turn-helix transcriptional regulator [Bacilli bacterium]